MATAASPRDERSSNFRQFLSNKPYWTPEFNPSLDFQISDENLPLSLRLFAWVKRNAWGNSSEFAVSTSGHSPLTLADFTREVRCTRGAASKARAINIALGYLRPDPKLLYPQVCPSAPKEGECFQAGNNTSPNFRLWAEDWAKSSPENAARVAALAELEKKLKDLKSEILLAYRNANPKAKPEKKPVPIPPSTAPETPTTTKATPAPVLPFPENLVPVEQALAPFMPPAGGAADLLKRCRAAVPDATPAEVAYWIIDRTSISLEKKPNPYAYLCRCVVDRFQSPSFAIWRTHRPGQTANSATEPLESEIEEEYNARVEQYNARERRIDEALERMSEPDRCDLINEAKAELRKQPRWARMTAAMRQTETESTARSILARRME